MPKLLSATPKYSKHRASGQAVVTISGRDFYLGPHGSKASRLEYDRLICEWLAAGRRLPGPTNQAARTVVQMLILYWRFAKQHYRKNGQPTNELDNVRHALRPLKRLYGPTPVNQFGPRALKGATAGNDYGRT